MDMDQRGVMSDDATAADDPQTPFLVGEIGTATTRLTLIDLVDGAFRLIARAEAPSTLTKPTSDALHAIWQLIPTLEGITGRSLTNGDAATIDTANYRLVVTTSAAGIAPVAVMALADASAHEATNAVRGIYAQIVQGFSLDDTGRSETGWLNEQLTQLAHAKPQVIVLAGGLERGARAPVARLAQLTRLLTRSMRPMPWLLYAGNSSASEQVRATLGDVTIVANLRPTATTNRLEPARAALRSFYVTHHLPGFPGADALQQHSITPSTVADNQGTMVRFLAARYARRTVFLDTGATHATAHAQSGGHFSQVILAGCGIGAGAPTLLQDVGEAAVARWLPYAVPEGDVANRTFNRAIWGSGAPADVADLLLDHALLRESFRATIQALRAARPTLEHDLVVAAGAIARSPSPGLAALTLIDALALDDTSGALAVDLYLDSLGLFAASGALAHIHPDAAACVLEQDALNSGPLATLLVPQGAVVEGKAALDIELTSVGVDGSTDVQSATVLGGEIVRLPLPRNARGTLRVQPVGGVVIGTNAAGAEVTTDEEAIIGSALGVIIDARPRPLQLPADDATRIARLRTWLAALDALPLSLLDEPMLADVSVATQPTTSALVDDQPEVADNAPELADSTDADASPELSSTVDIDNTLEPSTGANAGESSTPTDEPSEVSASIVANESTETSPSIVANESTETPASMLANHAEETGKPDDQLSQSSASVTIDDIVGTSQLSDTHAPATEQVVVYSLATPPAAEPAATSADAVVPHAEPGMSPDVVSTRPPLVIGARRRRITRIYAVSEPSATSPGDGWDTDEQQYQPPEPAASPLRGAVMKDDAPEPAPPTRKKRRFLWW